MTTEKITLNDIVVSLFLVAIVVLTCFNFYLFSFSFHKNLINSYSTNETYYELDKNTTRFVTGLDPIYNGPFNQKEVSHLNDVRKIIIIEEIINVILLISLMVFFITGQIHLFKQINICVIISIIMVFILLTIMNFFDSFFTVFHQVLFPQGNWMFPANSLIIQVYNEIFFQNFFLYTIATAAAVIMVLFVIIQIIKHSIELKKLSDKKNDDDK